MTRNQTLLRQLKEDYRTADLDDKDRTMLDYAVALTLRPAALSVTDIKKLRRVGFTDSDILNINLVASYFNFVNRVAEGLGVELEQSR